MLKRLWTAVLAAGVVIGAAGTADEAMTLKFKKKDKGEVVTETKSEEMNTLLNVTAGGAAQPERKEKGGSKLAYTEEVLERGEKDPKPTKAKRMYETAELMKGGKKVDLGLKGKTVVIEKAKDKYTFSVEDGQLSEDAADMLDKEFNKKDDANMEELMLPKKAVKVGDTWQVDVKAVEKMFGEEMKVDKDNAKVSAKLMKVYDKDKAKWGVIDYTIDVPISTVSVMGESIATTDGSKLKMTITLDGCIDGTVYGGTSSGKIEGSVGLKVPMAEIAINLKGTLSSKSEVLKK